MFSRINNALRPFWSAGNVNPDADSTYYPRSSQDVQLVYLALRRYLYAELIPGILDEAEYWIKQRTEENTLITVREQHGNLNYLSTSVPATPFRPIRRIIFAVTSRDQGWSDYRLDHGTYRNCWSWFEAHLVGPAPNDEVDGRANDEVTDEANGEVTDEANDEREDGVDDEGSDEDEEEIGDEVSPSETRTVLNTRLITNVHASRQFKEHIVIWDGDSEDAVIRQTLKTMGTHDTIELVARASFGGWANFVQRASIEMYVSAFRYTT